MFADSANPTAVLDGLGDEAGLDRLTKFVPPRYSQPPHDVVTDYGIDAVGTAMPDYEAPPENPIAALWYVFT